MAKGAEAAAEAHKQTPCSFLRTSYPAVESSKNRIQQSDAVPERHYQQCWDYLSNLSVLLEDGTKGLVGRLPRQATDENLLVHLQNVARQPVLTLDYRSIVYWYVQRWGNIRQITSARG